MSLIISNKKTLGKNYVVFLKNKSEEIETEIKGDLVLIKSSGEVVGLNILNGENKFEAKEGAHTLNSIQVDAIKKLGYTIENYESKFSVGEVILRESHPKSEKLFVLKVKTDKEIQIVTNSLNSLVGTKVVVANIDATLPSGLHIVKSKVMGVESNGMLCGGETLGREKTEGVLIIEDIPSGQKYIL